MRSGKLLANNDVLIDDFIEDNKYLITSDGNIYKKNTIKKLGRYDKEGYIEIYYKGKRLKAHRIIYRKFIGKLSEDLVIEHKNGLTDDNKPNNLMLVSQKKNIEYKLRRTDRGNVRKNQLNSRRIE